MWHSIKNMKNSNSQQNEDIDRFIMFGLDLGSNFMDLHPSVYNE